MSDINAGIIALLNVDVVSAVRSAGDIFAASWSNAAMSSGEFCPPWPLGS